MTITVTPTVDTANAPPRVQLSVSASAGETSTTVNRINADGSVVPVRTPDGNPLALSGGTGVLYDYEAPMGAACNYSSVESPGTVSAQVTVPGAQVWLIHPGVPSASMPVVLAPGAFSTRVKPAPRGVFAVMGKKNVVVFTDGARKGTQSQVAIYVRSATEKSQLEALLADLSPLLLNVPANLGYNETTKYISVGDLSEDVVTAQVTEQWMACVLPFDEVDRPIGGTQSQRTYTDVDASKATYALLDAAYPSYLALLAGP